MAQLAIEDSLRVGRTYMDLTSSLSLCSWLEPLCCSRMTSSDSISPYVDGWANIVFTNLVQPSLVWKSGTTKFQAISEKLAKHPGTEIFFDSHCALCAVLHHYLSPRTKHCLFFFSVNARCEKMSIQCIVQGREMHHTNDRTSGTTRGTYC